MTVPFIVGVWCTEFESHFTILFVTEDPKIFGLEHDEHSDAGMKISHIFVTLKLHL